MIDSRCCASDQFWSEAVRSRSTRWSKSSGVSAGKPLNCGTAASSISSLTGARILAAPPCRDKTKGTGVPLSRGFAGAYGLLDDAAVIAPASGNDLTLSKDIHHRAYRDA
jgi:hypothetical protein